MFTDRIGLHSILLPQWTVNNNIVVLYSGVCILPISLIKYNGPGLIKSIFDQQFPSSSIKPSYFNPIGPCICPINISSHVVNG